MGRKFISIALIVLFLFGCSYNSSTTKKTSDTMDKNTSDKSTSFSTQATIIKNSGNENVLQEVTTGQSINESEVLNFYKNFLEKLSIGDIENISKAIKEYSRIVSTDEKVNDGLFREFRNFYSEVIGKNMEIDYSKEDSSDFKDLISRNGIRICWSEAGDFLSEEPHFLKTVFTPFVSEGIAVFLSLREKHMLQTETYLLEDAGLSISWYELGERIVNCEKYIDNYSEYEEASEVGLDMKAYTELFIIENPYLDNAKKFDGEILKEDIKKAYEQLMVNYPSSKICSIIKIYYDILKKNNFVYSYEAETFLKNNGIDTGNDSKGGNSSNRIIGELNYLNDLKGSIINVEPVNKKDQEIFYATNSEELIKAIGPNRKVILKSEFYFLDDVINIKDVENLTIEGDTPLPVNILSASEDYVITFENTKNILLNNLRIGHAKALPCLGGVLEINNSNNFVINNSILFGCGAWGFQTFKTSKLSFVNSVIADCYQEGVIIMESKDFTFSNGFLANISFMNTVELYNDENIVFSDFSFVNNDTSSIIELHDTNINILIVDSKVENNSSKEFINDSSNTNIKIENVKFTRNNFDERSE